MAKYKRWFTAQKHEKDFWENMAKAIFSGASKQLGWYEWKARELEKLLSSCGQNILSSAPSILEIGSGPIGIINNLKYGVRCSIDPLENYYKSNKELIELRDNDVCHLSGAGECLPFKDQTLTFVIIDNVIDHTDLPDSVIKEIHRVLRNDGIMYITVNVHTKYGALLHEILARLNIDAKHPHTYTFDKISNLINTRFEILTEKAEDYHVIKKGNIESKSMKSKIKGYAGLSEMFYRAVCRKKQSVSPGVPES